MHELRDRQAEPPILARLPSPFVPGVTHENKFTVREHFSLKTKKF